MSFILCFRSIANELETQAAAVVEDQAVAAWTESYDAEAYDSEGYLTIGEHIRRELLRAK